MRMEDMSYPEFSSYRERLHTVLIPVGSVEAHGRHLPLGTDVFAPLEICRRVEKILKDRGIEVLVAPPIWYGHSFSLNVYPGTINVSAPAFGDYVHEVMREFVEEGLRRIVIINGHGGNVYPLVEAGEKLVEKADDVEVWLINWWMDFRDEILKVCESQGHAGEDETSVMLAVRPELVHMEMAKGRKVEREIRVIRRDIGRKEFPEAINDDPRGATREKGERIMDTVCERIADLLEAWNKDERRQD